MNNLVIQKVVEINRGEFEPIEAIEGDYNSRFVDFVILVNGKPLDITESQVRIYALPSNGKTIFNDLEIKDGKKGLARLELTKGILVKGDVPYMLKINTADMGLLSSNPFNIRVNKNLMEDSRITHTDEFTALENALNLVGNLNGIDVRSKTNVTNINKLGDAVNKHKQQLADNEREIDKFNVIYNNIPSNIKVKPTGIEIQGSKGTTVTTTDGDLAINIGGTVKKYPTLKYFTAVSVKSSTVAKVKLPKEFTARKDTLDWGVAVKGYYYNTTADFFPMYVAVNGAGTEEQDGYIYCKVEGIFKIQNADNSGDVQERSLNISLFAMA